MAKKIKLKYFTDERGTLTVLNNEIKFKIRRVYFIHDAKGIRGKHRHKKNIQALISVNGSCKVYVNNGKIKKNFILNKKNEEYIYPPYKD